MWYKQWCVLDMLIKRSSSYLSNRSWNLILCFKYPNLLRRRNIPSIMLMSSADTKPPHEGVVSVISVMYYAQSQLANLRFCQLRTKIIESSLVTTNEPETNETTFAVVSTQYRERQKRSRRLQFQSKYNAVFVTVCQQFIHSFIHFLNISKWQNAFTVTISKKTSYCTCVIQTARIVNVLC